MYSLLGDIDFRSSETKAQQHRAGEHHIINNMKVESAIAIIVAATIAMSYSDCSEVFGVIVLKGW